MNAASFPTFLAAGRALRQFLLGGLRFFRRLLFSRKSLIVYGCTASILALAWTLDLWLARRAWAAEKERLAAEGISLDPKAWFPTRPPDADNFFAIPELAPFQVADDGGRSTPEGRRLGMWFGVDYEVIPDKKGVPRRRHIATRPDYLLSPFSELCDYFRRTGTLPAVPLASDPAREILLSAAQWQPMLDHIGEAAATRPAAIVLPALADGGPDWRRHDLHSREWPMIRSLGLLFRVAVEAGDRETALKAQMILQRFSAGLRADGQFIPQLLARVYDSNDTSFIVAGMKRHLWTPGDLAVFGNRADESAAFAALHRALNLERISFNAYLSGPDCRKPQIITSKDFSGATRLFHGIYIMLCPESVATRYVVSQSETLRQVVAASSDNARQTPDWLSEVTKESSGRYGAAAEYGYLSLIPGFAVRDRLFRTALALESAFLADGRYPASLAALKPAIPPHLLADTDAAPLKYRTLPDGSRFSLWSVGKNRVDDFGAGRSGRQSDDVVLSTE